jgi:O-antigen ligase
MIEERPLLGYGIKSTRSLNIEKSENYPVLHVHNAVLEMVLETGLLGFIMIAIVILIFVAHFLMAFLRSKDIRLRQQGMAIFLCCIAYGINSMALTSMFHAWWFLYLVVLLILLKTAELRLKQ